MHKISNMKKYRVFVIFGYEIKTEQGQLIDSVEMQIIEDNEEDAMQAAKKLVKKPHYRTSMVIEKFYENT